MASSRIRVRMFAISLKPASADCTTERPSLALRTAWLKLFVCAVSDVLTPRPAASSPALVMR